MLTGDVAGTWKNTVPISFKEHFTAEDNSSGVDWLPLYPGHLAGPTGEHRHPDTKSEVSETSHHVHLQALTQAISVSCLA